MPAERQIIVNPQAAPAEQMGGETGIPPAHPHLVYFEPVEQAPGPPGSEGGLVEALHLVRARWWVVTSVIVIGCLTGVAVTFIQTPVFQAKTTLEVQAPVESVFGMQGNITQGSYQPESFLQTQVKNLESKSLQNRALSVLRAKTKPGTYAAADPRATFLTRLGLRSAAPADAGSQPLIPRRTVKVRAYENTHVVELLCDSADPRLSADYANTLAEEYAQWSLDSRWEGYKRTAEWLGRQLEGTKLRLEASERELQGYSSSSGLLFTDEKDSVQSGKLKQIQEELSRAQADRVSKQAVFEVAAGSPADSVPQVIDNERLNGYQVKLTELRREAAELSSLYTPEHYRVIRVRAQIAELEATFRREREAILTRIRNEYEAALRRERLLLADYNAQSVVVSSQAAKAIHYDVLKRDVDTNRQLYGALLQKVKEATVASALGASNVRIMDPAEPPAQPYEPNLIANMLKGIGAGLLLGLMCVLASERVNRSLRAPGETPFHLKVPELGVIPAGDVLLTQPREARSAAPGSLLAIGSPEGDTPADCVELVTWQDSNSALAESFRNTLVSILHSTNPNRPRVVLVTSASREEGKSTTVCNLGLGLAEINQRILLIDADLRKPRLNTLFHLSNSWGLSDLLRERASLTACPLEALARPTHVSGLWILPSGPGTLSISSLLYSERMEQLLERLRQEFNTILIDTPPMLGMSDARILGRLADAAILVVRAGHTTRDMAIAAKERMTGDGIPLIGTILNRWDQRVKPRYGTYDYGY